MNNFFLKASYSEEELLKSFSMILNKSVTIKLQGDKEKRVITVKDFFSRISVNKKREYFGVVDEMGFEYEFIALDLLQFETFIFKFDY
jgi:hypothetical protein